MRIVDTKGQLCPAPLIAAKKALKETQIPYLLTEGPKGGTPVAVAAVNSLINLLKEDKL